jgi:2-hydroxy-6-oxonona-2,4-dienedioate hydrolase
MMNRRRFLQISGLASVALLLASCGQKDKKKLAPDIPPRSQWMRLGPLESTYTQVNGIRMHALVSTNAAPAAEPVVLVHGSGLSGQYMIPTARELTENFHVLVPDIPGYGESGDPGKILNIAEMADWIADWMSAIDLPRASFLGNSFGCQVIVELATRYPKLVDRLLLQGPTTPPDERTVFWQFIRWRQNEPYNPPWLGKVTQEDYHKAGALRLLRSFMYQLADPIEKKVPYIQAPTLVIRGEFDPVARQDFCELLVRLLPHGELAIIPDVAHTLVFTAPTQLALVTRAFVAGDITWETLGA